MNRLKLKPQELSEIGYPLTGKARLVAVTVMLKHYRRQDKGFVMLLLRDILTNPLVYKQDQVLGSISEALVTEEK